ncbi:MAG: hypothetical protein ACR2O4_04365, partial [Hyphomicrobiaceae bacterium]
TALVGMAGTAWTLPATAGVTATQSAGPAGLIEIAGRVTNAHGAPEKRAYVEIMHQRVRDWTPGASGDAINVDEWSGPDWIGVWTDDDGIFGVHTWWSVDQVTPADLGPAPKQAEVLFNIETQDGHRSQWNVLLDPNGNYSGRTPGDPSTLTPVAWSERVNTAQFIANFKVG